MTNSEANRKQDIVPVPDKVKESGEVLKSNSELPTDELVKKHDKAIGAIMGHLRAKGIDEKERQQAQVAWRKEAQESSQEYAKKTQVRRALVGTLGYVGISALVSGWLNVGILGGAAVASMLGGMAGMFPLIISSVVRSMPFYQKFDKAIHKIFDKNLPEAKRKEEIMARNPSSPENKKILDFQIAEKIRNGVKKRQEASPKKEDSKNTLPKEVLAEMKALQAAG